MLSQEQYYEAKLFLTIYKDTLKCVEQVVKKKVSLDYQRTFYEMVKTNHVNKQIVFDEQGRLMKGPNIKDSCFWKYFELVETRVGGKLNLYKRYSFKALDELADEIISSIKNEIREIKEKSKTN